MKLTTRLDSPERQFRFTMLAVFAWGLLAHGYGFLHDSFSGDSLSEFYGKMGSNSWKIQLGRYVVPAYKMVFRTDMTLPWLVGLLSLVWIGLAVYMTIRIFRLEKRLQILLTAGIFTANITVAATAATYMHDYDCDMFALMCAAAAVYLWKEVPWGILPGALCVAVSMGIYQSYAAVTVVLVMFVCILDLMDGASFRAVMEKGLKAVAMILLGGVVYYAGLQLVLKLTHISMHTGDVNSLDAALSLTPGSIVYLTIQAYRDCLTRLLNAVSPYPSWLIRCFTLAQLLVIAVVLALSFLGHSMKLPEKLLCIALCGLIPFGMNFIYVLTGGVVHDLMVYAIWLTYLLTLLLADRLGILFRKKKDLPGWICAAMIFVILYGNVQTANALYLKKDMEEDAYLALMNRIVYRMEDMEDYQAGVTPVVFIGEHQLLNETIPGYEPYQRITGMDSSFVANTWEDYRLRTYFQTVMNYPAYVPGSDVFRAMESDPRVLEMPAYPDAGSIALVDNVLVVKLG